jgi:hypothetical protein
MTEPSLPVMASVLYTSFLMKLVHEDNRHPNQDVQGAPMISIGYDLVSS